MVVNDNYLHFTQHRRDKDNINNIKTTTEIIFLKKLDTGV